MTVIDPLIPGLEVLFELKANYKRFMLLFGLYLMDLLNRMRHLLPFTIRYI